MMLPSILLLQATALAALAAGNPLALRDPAPLPDGPLFDKLLFENPIILGGLLLIAGAVVFVLLNNRGRLKHAIGIALALALLGAAVFILANAVETDREKMATRTRKLIGAVSRAEIAQVEAMLDESCRLSAPLITSLSDKRAIVQLVQSNFAPGGVRTIKEAAVLEIQASKDGPDVGRTQVKVRATGMNGGISLSWWRLDFQKAGEGPWTVVGIEALDIGGL
jgi:hypothetical protein